MNNYFTVLVVDDEDPIRRFLKVSLEESNLRVIEASDGKSCLVQTATQNPDLILLDLGLPDLDGVEVTKDIRNWSKVPIIILSARGQEKDKIKALDSGADDYITKPFSVTELLARIRSIRRRAEYVKKVVSNIFETENGRIKVDFTKRLVFKDSNELKLTPKEYAILILLIKFQGCVITHKEILKEVWGQSYIEDTHYVRVFMKNLRQKLEDDPANPIYIITESGVGYRFSEK